MEKQRTFNKSGWRCCSNAQSAIDEHGLQFQAYKNEAGQFAVNVENVKTTVPYTAYKVFENEAQYSEYMTQFELDEEGYPNPLSVMRGIFAEEDDAEKPITLKGVIEICAGLNYAQTVELMLRIIRESAQLRKKVRKEEVLKGE